jgi:EAL domain-containing protein (putative c-di-GMP-specific phosphodiesterase class I)
MVSPMQFIPVAEQTGLIHPMTGLIMNVALNQAAHWLGKNQDLEVAVNISVRSLHDPQLADRIRDLLDAWQMPAEKLNLEITESAIMAEPARAQTILNQLADMGIKISIDDFGTGYSSLSYIKKLPVHEIKIDRSFVSDMLSDENDNVIVRATIDMAHDLGLQVTAEGVEDQSVLDRLKDYGCDHAQGFYMSRPLPAEELDNWLVESAWGFAGSTIGNVNLKH